MVNGSWGGGGIRKEGVASTPACKPFPIVLVKCWNVAHWNAKTLLKKCKNPKTLLPKFEKLPPKFLNIFIKTLISREYFMESAGVRYLRTS